MWRNDRFFYSKKLLRTIAENYTSIYDGLPRLNSTIVNLWELAEYKADFDMALAIIGRGKWVGDIEGKFKAYRNFDRIQRVVIADILGVSDDELEGLGFWDVLKMKSYAYYRMLVFLNGDKDDEKD